MVASVIHVEFIKDTISFKKYLIINVFMTDYFLFALYGIIEVNGWNPKTQFIILAFRS